MWITVIDVFFGLSLFFNASLFIPQIITLIREKESKDVSIITFAGFLVIQFAAICYGYVHRDLLLFFGYILSAMCCSSVVWLIMFYRIKKK
jgi:MtN3 and saliva related transmembrane protein